MAAQGSTPASSAYSPYVPPQLRRTGTSNQHTSVSPTATINPPAYGSTPPIISGTPGCISAAASTPTGVPPVSMPSGYRPVAPPSSGLTAASMSGASPSPPTPTPSFGSVSLSPLLPNSVPLVGAHASNLGMGTTVYDSLPLSTNLSLSPYTHILPPPSSGVARGHNPNLYIHLTLTYPPPPLHVEEVTSFPPPGLEKRNIPSSQGHPPLQ